MGRSRPLPTTLRWATRSAKKLPWAWVGIKALRLQVPKGLKKHRILKLPIEEITNSVLGCLHVTLYWISCNPDCKRFIVIKEN